MTIHKSLNSMLLDGQDVAGKLFLLGTATPATPLHIGKSYGNTHTSTWTRPTTQLPLVQVFIPLQAGSSYVDGVIYRLLPTYERAALPAYIRHQHPGEVQIPDYYLLLSSKEAEHVDIAPHSTVLSNYYDVSYVLDDVASAINPQGITSHPHMNIGRALTRMNHYEEGDKAPCRHDFIGLTGQGGQDILDYSSAWNVYFTHPRTLRTHEDVSTQMSLHYSSVTTPTPESHATGLDYQFVPLNGGIDRALCQLGRFTTDENPRLPVDTATMPMLSAYTKIDSSLDIMTVMTVLASSVYARLGVQFMEEGTTDA